MGKKKDRKKLDIQGIVVPVLTPFGKDRSVDFKVLEKLVDWLSNQKISALFFMGGSGEYQTLTLDERRDIISCAVETCGRKTLVLAGSGGKSPGETLILSEYAWRTGCDGLGVVIPEFIRADEVSIYRYFEEIDRNVDLPVMVYDPRGAGPLMATPSLMRRMIENLPHIAGIKYRATNAEYMANMAREIADEIALLSGNEYTFLQDLSVGAVGCVGGGGNFYPNLLWKIQDHFMKGNLSEARKLQFEVIQAIHTLGPIYWPMSGKLLLREIGIPVEPVTRVKGPPYAESDIQKMIEVHRPLLKKDKAFRKEKA